MTAPHFDTEHVTVWHGDCIDVMRDLPDASVDAVVTDPPYGLEFMGREWDGADGFRRSLNAADVGRENTFGRMSAKAPEYRAGKLFQDWCELWATEALRVLKPGGHLLAFGGTRTFHRLTAGIEDAGFEIRDSIAWLYGSGFPKSLDVSKAIDKMKPQDDIETVRVFLEAAWRASAVASSDIDAAFGFRGNMAAPHWFYKTSQNAVPTAEQWPRLLDMLNVNDVPDDVREACERVLTSKGLPGPNWFARTITGTHAAGLATGAAGVGGFGEGKERRDQAATEAAARWQGWGTALKPAFEPIVVARKPLTGTVAANVLAYGTGALNIDASRIGTTDALGGGAQQGSTSHADGWDRPWKNDAEATAAHAARVRANVQKAEQLGRWPANVVLDASQAAALDQQSGTLTSGALKPYTEQHENASSFRMDREKTYESQANSGGASRFFKTVDDVTPRFMYTAKAGSDERPNVDGVAHPTVKSLDLMRWLVKLVTPKGGTVLEPFAGSGTTVEAAVLEGFRCIAIEREADYLPLIMQRVSKPHAVGLDFDFETPAPAPAAVDNGRRGEASAARRYTEKGGTNFAPLPGRRRDERPPRPEPDPASGLDFGDWEDVS